MSCIMLGVMKMVLAPRSFRVYRSAPMVCDTFVLEICSTSWWLRPCGACVLWEGACARACKLTLGITPLSLVTLAVLRRICISSMEAIFRCDIALHNCPWLLSLRWCFSKKHWGDGLLVVSHFEGKDLLVLSACVSACVTLIRQMPALTLCHNTSATDDPWNERQYRLCCNWLHDRCCCSPNLQQGGMW